MANVLDTYNITSSLVEDSASQMTPDTLLRAFVQKTRPAKSKLTVLNVSTPKKTRDYYD